MIEKLKLHNTASYTNAVEINPTEINYFFGSNGTGKTSLGNVIANCDDYVDCSLEWRISPIETLVYNKNFVDTSFGQSQEIQGIFTLGKEEKESQTFIDDSKKEIESLKKQIEGLNQSIDKQKEKLQEKKIDTIAKAWSIKVKFEEDFKPAFTGFMGSGEAFFNKCIAEHKNSSDLLSEEAIKDKCTKVFNSDLKSYDEIKPLDYSELSTKEESEILSTKIIGKEDVQIGELIKKLDNSDWVKDGVDYLQTTEDTCPFCQQGIETELRVEIESFFDETYEENKQKLNDFIDSYSSYVSELIEKLESVSKLDIPILNFTELSNKIELLQEVYKNNLSSLSKKQKTPSVPISLETINPSVKSAADLIEAYIAEIKSNNSTVKNISAEKTKLKSEIWRFVVNELTLDLKSYFDTKEKVEKAIEGIEKTKKEKSDKQIELSTQVKIKEAEVTSVLPTVNEINKILVLFGFTNFKLDEAEKKGFYKIVREDGSDVEKTLSEGEYTFVTFLYFYHLLKGSTNESGLASDKVVVIDDPISSLDSNILFVVSNLIKSIVEDVKNGRNGLKQIFILTHNVYFYKEVTFLGSRHHHSNKSSFWIVRKLENQSKIIKHDENPIQTTYELLWRELDDLENINTATIFNTLRRILEYYFNILGGLDYEKAISEFEGEELIICKSLVSWINDGSHFINDDLVVYVEPESIEKYLKVFKDIFINMGHESHFDMMRRAGSIPA
jgi:wobble nucleotide-excising tRNase